MDVVFLITAHVPYLRGAGRAPVGEDQLHRTIAEGLIPLLNLLNELHSARLNPRIGLAISPILLEQLVDSVVQKHFVVWMQNWLDRAERDVQRWEREGVSHQAYLARFYLEWGRSALESFEERYSRDLVGALRDLCVAGVVEPLAAPASYAYLPLLGDGPSLRAQLELGVLSITRHLGRPRGLWLPGCGVAPTLVPAIVATGLGYLVVDPFTVVPKQPNEEGEPQEPAWLVPRRLATLPIDDNAGLHVWSWEQGYPGDPLYRDARRDARSGLAYWAGGADGAAPYDPYHAFRRAHEHAGHFVALLRQQAERRTSPLVLPIDLALLGMRWFEGPTWLRAVLMQCSGAGGVIPALPHRVLRTARSRSTGSLLNGSWSVGSDHSPWRSSGTVAYWREVQSAEARLATLANELVICSNLHERLMNQAMRELLLAQSSDWPLMLTANDDVAEATRHWRTHLRRCTMLCDYVTYSTLDHKQLLELEQLEEQDNPFPELNYRIFETS